MVKPQRVEDDVYFVEHPIRPNWFCGVTVVLGRESIGVVDSGFADTAERYLFPALESLGRDWREITTVANTHRDGDHVQGNRVLKEKTGALIAIHEKDAPDVETFDRTFRDGDLITLGDRAFRVVHLPGHTPGNSCLFDERDGLLISGDTLVGERRELIRLGVDMYVASLERLAGLAPRTLIMSHPFQPAGTNVLRGRDIEAMIGASIRIARALPDT